MQNNYANRGRPELEFAGFWVRLAAYLIDLGIVWIGLLFVNLVIGIMSFAGGGLFRTRWLFQYTVKDTILYLLQVAYFILLTYYTETTPGKRLMNLRVVPADGNRKLTFVSILYRETVGRFLCGLSIGIGYIMAGVDREKRGLHDMICDTRVVYGKRIKVVPKYQAMAAYPPIPPVPPAPPVSPYGRPSGGNGPSAYGPISPYGNANGNMPAGEGTAPGKGYGQMPHGGSPLPEKEKDGNPVEVFGKMPENDRAESEKVAAGNSSVPINVSEGSSNETDGTSI